MEDTGKISRPLKRPLPLSDDDDDDSQLPSDMPRRPRFPKGKKAKTASAAPSGGDVGGEDIDSLMDPQLAAKKRAKTRRQSREDELHDGVAAFEVHYEDDANFLDDGIEIEPFNLDQEREEGYFDANGNFVEYAGQNKLKDAWLDSAEASVRFAGRVKENTNVEEDYQDLSSEEIGKIKRNIANMLQPGETIMQALRRLKGTSADKRGKMPEATKRIFDQLTEAAVKLMENGEYNVYQEERETFEREAEGYERLAHSRGGSSGVGLEHKEDIFPDLRGLETNDPSIWDMALDPAANISAPPVSSSDADSKYDMFGDDDGNAEANLQAEVNATSSASTEQVPPTSGSFVPSYNLTFNETAEGGVDSDYVYDQSSGYYYSSSLGYYYDPASGLYCCASTGTWYSFDDQTGCYTEIPSVATSES